MKKVLGIVLLMAISTACSKKNETFCWECRVTISYTGSPMPGASSTSKKCDLTEAEARKMEEAGTSTTTSSAGGITVTMNTTTVCHKVQ